MQEYVSVSNQTIPQWYFVTPFEFTAVYFSLKPPAVTEESERNFRVITFPGKNQKGQWATVKEPTIPLQNSKFSPVLMMSSGKPSPQNLQIKRWLLSFYHNCHQSALSRNIFQGTKFKSSGLELVEPEIMYCYIVLCFTKNMAVCHSAFKILLNKIT